jgi:hypothetical protein
MNHIITCPICGCSLSSSWQADIRRSFTGVYVCRNCGHLKITGYLSGGEHVISEYIPACTNHGLDPMIPVGLHTWRCTAEGCGRVYAQFGSSPVSSKIVLTWRPGMRRFPPITMETFAVEAYGGSAQ